MAYEDGGQVEDRQTQPQSVAAGGSVVVSKVVAAVNESNNSAVPAMIHRCNGDHVLLTIDHVT